MRCRRAAEFITRELDESLPFLSRTGLELHTLLCSSCRRLRAQVAVVHRVVCELIDDGDMPSPVVELPEETKNHLKSLIQENLGPLP